MASFMPEQTKHELTEKWEWSEANETPLPGPNYPYYQVTWDGNPIRYRGILINGESILTFHNEEDFLALSIVDQFWLSNYIVTCDAPPTGEIKAHGNTHRSRGTAENAHTPNHARRRRRSRTCGTGRGSGGNSESGGKTARPDRDRWQDLALPPARPETEEKTARVSRGEKQDRQGREGCLWGWVRKTIFRTSKGGRVDALQGINKRQTTTGYRGIRVGEEGGPARHPETRIPGPLKDKSPTTRRRRATNRTRSLKPEKKET